MVTRDEMTDPILLASIREEVDLMTPDEIAHHIAFWYVAAKKWNEWADRLVQHPDPLTLYGHEEQRVAIAQELAELRHEVGRCNGRCSVCLAE